MQYHPVIRLSAIKLINFPKLKVQMENGKSWQKVSKAFYFAPMA